MMIVSVVVLVQQDEAISEGASHYEINADVCVDCGACAGTCPVGAPNPQ